MVLRQQTTTEPYRLRIKKVSNRNQKEPYLRYRLLKFETQIYSPAIIHRKIQVNRPIPEEIRQHFLAQ